MEVYEASLLFYGYVYAVCFVAHSLVDLLHQLFLRESLKTLATELIATVALATPLFDVGIILGTYGLLGVFVQISFLTYMDLWAHRPESIRNPCVLSRECWNERLTEKGKKVKFAMFTGVYVLAAFVSFKLARSFWYWGMIPEHTAAFNMDHCHSDLTVRALYGCAIECIGTFLIRLAELRVPRKLPQAEWLIMSFLVGFLTVLGIRYTGFYCNPVVAFACVWDCSGTTRLEHVAVYWLAPMVGYLAVDAVERPEPDEVQAPSPNEHEHAD